MRQAPNWEYRELESNEGATIGGPLQYFVDAIKKPGKHRQRALPVDWEPPTREQLADDIATQVMEAVAADPDMLTVSDVLAAIKRRAG